MREIIELGLTQWYSHVEGCQACHVFDNAAGQQAVHQWKPCKNGQRILITMMNTIKGLIM